MAAAFHKQVARRKSLNPIYSVNRYEDQENQNPESISSSEWTIQINICDPSAGQSNHNIKTISILEKKV